MGKHSAEDKPREQRVTENGDYIAMMQRMIRRLEQRTIDDPAMLAEVIMLAQRLAEIPNVVIATSAARYKMDPYKSPSAGELGRLLGMTPQSASERRKVGDRILAERAMGEDTIPRRERAARTRARKHADEMLAAWLERRDTNV